MSLPPTLHPQTCHLLFATSGVMMMPLMEDYMRKFLILALFATCMPAYAQYGDGGYSESGAAIAGEQENYRAMQEQANANYQAQQMQAEQERMQEQINQQQIEIQNQQREVYPVYQDR